jgi:acetyl-CoA acetyltransferase
MDKQNTIKDKAAIVGVGESRYYKRGGSPISQFSLACHAIIQAAEDAGIEVSEIDGFASYANDQNDPSRLAAALGLRELNFCNLAWTGGGGVAAAVANAAAAVAAGYARQVAVFRSLAQGRGFRLGQAHLGGGPAGLLGFTLPYGVASPAQRIALRVRRFMYEHKVKQDALAAIALTSYHHAQFNPRAVMYGRPLSAEAYHNSRWIVEPFHLFDCCMENDGAAAVIVTTAERARDLRQKPVFIMAAAQGSDPRDVHDSLNIPDFGSANFKHVARRLYEMAGIGPQDVDVVQSYDHFSGAVMITLVEHGFCAPDEINDFCTVENLTWPSGKLPLNTSGGNLAECYVIGMQLVNEAVRQVRGISTCQVKDAVISMMISGSATTPTSNIILHG